jgi:spermidine synthase
MELWFNEHFEDAHLAVGARTSIKIKDILYSGKSEYQKIDIVETTDFGRMMLLDGIIMLTEKFEFSYHEMITHVPLFTHPNPERVLVIGGGDGGTAREVVKHKSVKECVMVEIDGCVVEKSKEFFPTLSSVFNDPKLTLLIEDGVSYMQEHRNEFDIIIIDSTDPIGPAEGLFSQKFYQNVYDALKKDGIVTAQGESSYYYPNIQKNLLSNIKKIFPYVTMYMSFIPFYPGGAWSLAFGSKKHKETDTTRFDEMEAFSKNLRYFNENIYRACFYLPNFAKEIVESIS